MRFEDRNHNPLRRLSHFLGPLDPWHFYGTQPEGPANVTSETVYGRVAHYWWPYNREVWREWRREVL